MIIFKLMIPEAGVGLFFIECNKGIAGFRATFWKRYGINIWVHEGTVTGLSNLLSLQV